MLQAGVAAAQQAHNKRTQAHNVHTGSLGDARAGRSAQRPLIKAVRAPLLAAGLGLHGESEAVTVAAPSPEEEGREEEKNEESGTWGVFCENGKHRF